MMDIDIPRSKPLTGPPVERAKGPRRGQGQIIGIERDGAGGVWLTVEWDNGDRLRHRPSALKIL